MTSTPKTIDHPLAAAFEQAFRQAARNSAFAIGGTVPLGELCNGSLELYYKPIGGEGPCTAFRNADHGGKAHVSVCDAPFSVTAAKRLFDAGAPSPHGQGGKTVYDRTYRDARELKVCQPGARAACYRSGRLHIRTDKAADPSRTALA